MVVDGAIGMIANNSQISNELPLGRYFTNSAFDASTNN